MSPKSDRENLLVRWIGIVAETVHIYSDGLSNTKREGKGYGSHHALNKIPFEFSQAEQAGNTTFVSFKNQLIQVNIFKMNFENSLRRSCDG